MVLNWEYYYSPKCILENIKGRHKLWFLILIRGIYSQVWGIYLFFFFLAFIFEKTEIVKHRRSMLEHQQANKWLNGFRKGEKIKEIKWDVVVNMKSWENSSSVFLCMGVKIIQLCIVHCLIFYSNSSLFWVRVI